MVGGLQVYGGGMVVNVHVHSTSKACAELVAHVHVQAAPRLLVLISVSECVVSVGTTSRQPVSADSNL